METGEVHAQLKKKPSLFQETRKDPFSLPPGVRLFSKEIPVQESKKILQAPEEVKPAEVMLKLKAILIGDHIRLASIDRSIVSIGDFINGEKVLEIRSDRVILEKEGKKRTIFLEQSPIKLTVEER
jgi:type II secretory pathway component PulC